MCGGCYCVKNRIGIIYRPPDPPICMFNEHLKNVIGSVKCSNIPYINTNSCPVKSSLYQDILVTDITDHYPVFLISHFHDNQANSVDTFFLVRKISKININALRNTVINFE